MLTLQFAAEKETKNAVRFYELDDAGERNYQPIAGNLYINKAALKTIGDPDTLVVVVGARKEFENE